MYQLKNCTRLIAFKFNYLLIHYSYCYITPWSFILDITVCPTIFQLLDLTVYASQKQVIYNIFLVEKKN